MGLLEYVTKKNNLNYLSDIKICRFVQSFKRIRPEKFPIREWNEAIRYITGKNIAFSDASEAKRFLVSEI